jgi:hypothetical protein
MKGRLFSKHDIEINALALPVFITLAQSIETPGRVY